jgi:hypothetical protein
MSENMCEQQSNFSFDKELSGYFVQVPVELLKENICSPVALKLYLVLLSYCGKGDKAWPGQSRLAQDMGLSERRVRDILGELERVKLLSILPRTGTSNVYHLHCLVSQSKANEQAEKFRGERKYPAETGEKVRKNPSAEVHDLESYRVESQQTYQVCEVLQEVDPLVETKASNNSGMQREMQQKLQQAGVSKTAANSMVLLALHNKRDIIYLERLLEWVKTQPNISNPAAYLATLIKLDVNPPDSNISVTPTSKQKGPTYGIDWTKYSPGGKYAYLAGSVS